MYFKNFGCFSPFTERGQTNSTRPENLGRTIWKRLDKGSDDGSKLARQIPGNNILFVYKTF